MGDTTDNWNFADIFETIADHQGDRTLLVHGGTHRTWAEVDRRADGVARTLLDAGVVEQDKVAQYLYNCDAYMESQWGIFKAGLVPVNTNYRYVDDELAYLWDNADAVAVVFHGCFTERCENVRPRVPNVRTWIWVDDGSGPAPSGRSPTRPPSPPRPSGSSRPGVAAATTSSCSTRAAPPACRRA